MSLKISKKGANTIKTLILLVAGTILAVQVLPKDILVFVYPALMLALIALLPIFHKYRKTPDFSFFGNLCLAVILAVAFFLLMPLVQDLGVIGYGILSFVYIFLAMTAERIMGSDIDATLMTIIFLVFASAANGMDTITRSFPAFLTAAVLLDLSRKGFPTWVRGAFTGLIWSVILFGFSSMDLLEIYTAVVYSTAAGLVAGSLFGIFHLDDEKHIEKILKKW